MLPVFRLCQRGHDRCDKRRSDYMSDMVFRCYTIRIISHRSCTFRGHLRSTGQFRYITCRLPSMRCACITSVTSTWFVALQIGWPVNDLLIVLFLWLLTLFREFTYVLLYETGHSTLSNCPCSSSSGRHVSERSTSRNMKSHS